MAQKWNSARDCNTKEVIFIPFSQFYLVSNKCVYYLATTFDIYCYHSYCNVEDFFIIGHCCAYWNKYFYWSNEGYGKEGMEIPILVFCNSDCISSHRCSVGVIVRMCFISLQQKAKWNCDSKRKLSRNNCRGCTAVSLPFSLWILFYAFMLTFQRSIMFLFVW